MNDILKTAAAFEQSFLTFRQRFATAESCTGGLIAAAITEIPGSSAWFERGFVTYTNVAKMELFGVSAAALESFGAVSVPVAREMAAGALLHSHADVAAAVTGIAGPSGGSALKPVGTVCIAFMCRGRSPVVCTHHFSGSRHEVRAATVLAALNGLLICASGAVPHGYS